MKQKTFRLTLKLILTEFTPPEFLKTHCITVSRKYIARQSRAGRVLSLVVNGTDLFIYKSNTKTMTEHNKNGHAYFDVYVF